MIIISKGTRIIDIVKYIENVENGLKICRLDDTELIYATGEIFTLTEIETIPIGVNINELYNYNFLDGNIVKLPKKIYSKAQFAKLFTPTEFMNIKNSEDITIQYFLTIMLDLVKEIDLEDYNTYSALVYFKETGYISDDKFNKITEGITPKYNLPQEE